MNILAEFGGDLLLLILALATLGYSKYEEMRNEQNTL